MNRITNMFIGTGTPSGMLFFTVLVTGFSLFGLLLPVVTQATDLYDGYTYYDDYSYSPDYTYYDDYYYNPGYTYYDDYSYSPGYTYYDDYSYNPGYTYYDDYSFDTGYTYYDDYYYNPGYTYYDDYSYSPSPGYTYYDDYYPSYDYSYYTPSYYSPTYTGYSTPSQFTDTTGFAVYVDGKCYSNCRGGGGGYSSYSTPMYTSAPKVTYSGGCGYSSGGCGGGSSSSSNYTSTVNTTTVTNIDNSINDSFNTNTNIQYTIQSQNPYYYVAPQPTCTMNYAQPSNYYGGTQSVLLSWNSTNATSAYISSIGSVSVNGSQYVYPTSGTNTTYTMTVYNTSGTANTCSVTIPPQYYTPPVTNAPTCTLTASPSSIQNGLNAVLSWTSYNAISATLSDGLGNVVLNGTLNVRPESSRVYTLTVRDYQGRTNTCYANLTVSGSYVSLTSIPYTGFDGGIFGNSLYWIGLALFALAAGYIVTRHLPASRGFSMSLFNREFAVASSAPVAEPIILEEYVVAKQKSEIATVKKDPPAGGVVPSNIPAQRMHTTDAMSLQTVSGEMPRLVVVRE